MYNLHSQPAFAPPEGHTADAGCYEIDSGTDFTPDLNFLMGMAAMDNVGRMVPVASFEAPGNARVNIRPHADYYIAISSYNPGTAIDFKVESKDAAHIDFTSNPGLYGAIVTCESDGAWDIKYVAKREDYLDLVRSLKQGGSSLERKVNRLEKQLSTVLKYLPAAAAAEPELSQMVSKKPTKVTGNANGF